MGTFARTLRLQETVSKSADIIFIVNTRDKRAELSCTLDIRSHMDRLPSHCGRDEGARSDSDPRIAGFIRTCAKDVDFLVFALRSICKFAFPLLSSVTVVFPEHERSQLEPLLRGAFPWVTVRPTDTEVRIAAQFLNLTGRIADIKPGWP